MASYGPASVERIAETDALIAAFAAAPNYSAYLTAYSAVEQRANSEDVMGRFEERDRIWTAIKSIKAEKAPALRAEYDAIPVFSLAELVALSNPKQSEAA